MKRATLCFLVKKYDGKIVEILLGMKKRGFGIDKWNGVGGKLQINESSLECVIRETQEEIGVLPINLEHCAQLNFDFIGQPDIGQNVDVFITDKWQGKIKESEEMRPAWFQIDKIPYEQMWWDDKYWLPKILQGEKLRGEFVFKDDKLIEQKVITVSKI